MDYNITVALGDVSKFLNSIFYELKNLDVEVGLYQLDHLCYQTSTSEEYQKKKSEILRFAELISEELRGNRLISTFKLEIPIVFKNHHIYIIELPEPLSDQHYKAGLEHIEFVVGDELDELIIKYPNLDWDISGLKNKMNPELKLKLNRYQVRFHQESLESEICQRQLMQ